MTDTIFVSMMILGIFAPFALLALLTREETAQCGHKTRRIKTTIEIFGQPVKLIPPWRGPIRLCPNCIAQKAIKCASCGRPILPGSFLIGIRQPNFNDHNVLRLEYGNGTWYAGCVKCGEFGLADAIAQMDPQGNIIYETPLDGLK